MGCDWPAGCYMGVREQTRWLLYGRAGRSNIENKIIWSAMWYENDPKIHHGNRRVERLQQLVRLLGGSTLCGHFGGLSTVVESVFNALIISEYA